MSLSACLEGVVDLAATPGSVLVANLDHRPAVALTVTDRDHDLTMFGEAALLGRASDLADRAHRLDALSARGQFTPDDWDGYLYEVRAERIFLSR